MWVHLSMDDFHKYVLQYYTICGWLNSQMQSRGSGELTVKLHVEFWLHRGSVSVSPELFKGQLYLKEGRKLVRI